MVAVGDKHEAHRVGEQMLHQAHGVFARHVAIAPALEDGDGAAGVDALAEQRVFAAVFEEGAC